MAAICAKPTAGVDVKRTLRIGSDAAKLGDTRRVSTVANRNGYEGVFPLSEKASDL